MDKTKGKQAKAYSPGNKKRRVGKKNSETSDNSQSPSTSCDDLLSRKVKNSIGRFYVESGLDFNIIDTSSFKKMITLCSGNVECSLPTLSDLKGSIFKDMVKEMHDYVGEIRDSWADTGCSVLLDEWIDPKGRNLLNVLVDSPKGTTYFNSSDVSDIIGDINAMEKFFEIILREIGINNVVQIITSSTLPLMKEIGKRLMEKFRTIFWTVSASCCVGLMLDKISTMDHIKETLDKANIITRYFYSLSNVLEYLRDQMNGRDLVKPSKTRSAQPFLNLENIVFEKEILIKMFLSSDPMSGILRSTIEGKRVFELMTDCSFWTGASTVVKAAMPLVRVMEWMSESDKRQIGYIYETIDQAKEKIKEKFLHKKPHYMPYWEIIDEVWCKHLYSPIHSACYFLNPNLFYSGDFYVDPEVTTGLLHCIMRSTEDLRVQDQMILHLEQYRHAKGCFSVGRDTDPASFTPVLWWYMYGKGCPELQRLAIRILNQTCDGASRFELKRDLAETLFKKGIYPVEQKRLTDMAYLRYNMLLQNHTSGEGTSLTADETETEPVDD